MWEPHGLVGSLRAPLSVQLSVDLSRLFEFGLEIASRYIPHPITRHSTMLSVVCSSHKKQNKMSNNSHRRYPSRTRTKTPSFLDDIQEDTVPPPGKTPGKTPAKTPAKTPGKKLPPKKSSTKKNANKKRRTKKTSPELPPPQSPDFVISKVVEGETPRGANEDIVVLMPVAIDDKAQRLKDALNKATQWHLILGDENGATTLVLGRNHKYHSGKVSIAEIVETLKQSERSHKPRNNETINENGKLIVPL